jgi:endoglucanase
MRAKHPDLRLEPTGRVRNGKDFRVESLSGVNYPCHVHLYDGTVGLVELVAHVPLNSSAASPLALYFDQVGMNGEDLAGSWNNKALAVYHLPSLGDFSGNNRHLSVNLPAGSGYDLGPIYTTNWTKQQLATGTISNQQALGVELKAGADPTATDGDIFLFAKKAPVGTKWTFEFDYTQLDTHTTTTGAGCFARLGILRGNGAGGIEADPNLWSSTDAGDLSDNKINDNAAATGGGLRASINTLNSPNPTNSNRLRVRRYDGNNAQPPEILPVSGAATGDPFTFVSGVKYHIKMMRDGNKLDFIKTAPGKPTETTSYVSPFINAIGEAWLFLAATNGRRFKVENATLGDTVSVAIPWGAGGNLAGAEFGHGVGDVYNTHYTWPTNQEIDYYAAKGMTWMRLPWLFHRIIQSADMTRLLATIDYGATKGITFILDPHEYGMINGVPVSDPTARTAFVNYWTTVANATKAKTNIYYELMNEPMNISVPGGITASDWLVAANAAIAAIRATGATQLILVPGTDWTGAHSWMNNNAAVMGGVVDPLNKFVYTAHQYLDSDRSGTHRDAVAGLGSTALINMTNWARGLGKQIILGEFGFASPEGTVEATALMNYMKANNDVWAGWTYWAGGPWWGEYMFTIEPLSLTSGPARSQMNTIQPFLAG